MPIKERMSLAETVQAMEAAELVLPLFQRPFIWTEEQICDFFDSVLQNYPLGSVLLLDSIPKDLERRIHCCHFKSKNGRDFQEQSLQQRRSESHLAEDLSQPCSLVIDGQQRLFAIYIGLKGAYLHPSAQQPIQGALAASTPMPAERHLYCDLRNFLVDYYDNGSSTSLKCLPSRRQHQFTFYTEEERDASLKDTSLPKHCQQAALLFKMHNFITWGKDQRLFRPHVREHLRQLEGVSNQLADELEYLLDQLHHNIWHKELIQNSFFNASNSFSLIEVFTRLNQGSSFKPSDLSYAIRIIFPEEKPSHLFSSFLEQREDLHNAENQHNYINNEQYDPLLLDEYYESIQNNASELKLDLNIFYQSYLFCEEGNILDLTENIIQGEGALALRNNAPRLLRFYECLYKLREVIEACQNITRHWFSDQISNIYFLFPVYYFLYIQADEFTDSLEKLSICNLSRIIRWIAINEIKQELFRGGKRSSQNVWQSLFSAMQACHETESCNFPLAELDQYIFEGSEGQRRIRLSEQEIDSLLSNTKQQHRSVAACIALLYSHPQRICLMSPYEERQIDFIQPKKLLSRRELKKQHLPEHKVEEIYSMRDSLLNMQWVPKRFKSEKGDIPFALWLLNSQQLNELARSNEFKSEELLHNYMRFHHLLVHDNLFHLLKFSQLMEQRREILKKILLQYGNNFSNWDLELKLPAINYPAF